MAFFPIQEREGCKRAPFRTEYVFPIYPHEIPVFSNFETGVTGCLKPFDRLNINDKGGQYNSSQGGHPHGSICIGYKHYVQVRLVIYFIC